MLMRRAKAYSSSCSQIVLVYLQPFRRNLLLKCAPQPKIPKIKVQSLLKSSMLTQLKSLSLVIIVIGSISMSICNRFHERLANSSKITTFTG